MPSFLQATLQQFLKTFNGTCITLITSAIWRSDTPFNNLLTVRVDKIGELVPTLLVHVAGHMQNLPVDWVEVGIVRGMTLLELFPVYIAILL